VTVQANAGRRGVRLTDLWRSIVGNHGLRNLAGAILTLTILTWVIPSLAEGAGPPNSSCHTMAARMSF
jgi:hypothetical protein